MKDVRVQGRRTLRQRLRKDMSENGGAYVLALAVLAYYFLFHYKPMGGLVIAFKNYVPRKGIWGSKWVGMKYFLEFFNSYYFERVLRNTLVISLSSLIFAFPLPILFALSINEVKSKAFKKTVQTISYMPYFISLVVLAGIIIDFTSSDGLVGGTIMQLFTGKR